MPKPFNQPCGRQFRLGLDEGKGFSSNNPFKVSQSMAKLASMSYFERLCGEGEKNEYSITKPMIS